MEEDELFLFGAAPAATKEPGLLHADPDAITETSFSLYEQGRHPSRVAVAISSDAIGSIDPTHGADLLIQFVKNLCERALLPDEVLLYHRGVLLLSENHGALEWIRCLCNRDVEVKACEESLNFYAVKPDVDKVRAVPMSEITRSLLRADRLVHP